MNADVKHFKPSDLRWHELLMAYHLEKLWNSFPFFVLGFPFFFLPLYPIVSMLRRFFFTGPNRQWVIAGLYLTLYLAYLGHEFYVMNMPYNSFKSDFGLGMLLVFFGIYAIPFGFWGFIWLTMDWGIACRGKR